MPETVLDRRTLNRTLLARQGLLRREPRAAAGTIEHLVGMQSQVPRDPFVALWSRIEAFDPRELDRLMAERETVRTGLNVDVFRRLTPEERSAVDAEADALLRFVAPDAESRSVEMTVLG